MTPELMNIKQVQEYIGQNIGRDTLRKLMDRDIIKTVRYGSKNTYLTRKKYVDAFLDMFFANPMQIPNVIDSIPVNYENKLIQNGLSNKQRRR